MLRGWTKLYENINFKLVYVVPIEQVEEEIDIQLNLEDTVDLTSFLDQSTGCRVFPPPVMESKFLFEAKFIQGY
ncbi:nudix hydrolase 14 [Cucumis melo var. makuwa]|uniref:Nudix hydrolase 14 n=1 Tax=Cucumis melo var. makuwa TaxID=1194695 RepID=A0A5D3E1Y3_CUCMM|nr:nudix hydrolase 14 [Cucumis melo var. makuwa]TYK29395.1 nudix hydrolase 14 [Cucumis melo var. makuwa]